MMTCSEIYKCRFYFNEMIDIEKITGSRWFNNFVDILVLNYASVFPSNVQYLTFGENFNQPIKKCIPSFVTHLTFGRYFNQSIENSIPSLVTHLNFDNYFNKSIENNIPPSVTHLKLGHNFKTYSENSIPSTVTHLRLCCCKNDIKCYLPSSIKEISFDTDLDNYERRNIISLK